LKRAKLRRKWSTIRKVGWSWGCVSAIDSNGRTTWIGGAHRDDGKRFVARANEKLTAFLELESVIHRSPPISDRRKLDNFLLEIGLSFAFRDE
jgi:hypothetical protein